ncbi:hypothetical protein EB796_001970 [Bugula neritina]|uniref:Fibronectin type-III domain-containing protein n=1 Tax=Bugula neritina TaxID=10212 RepID=A0A7J7KNG8_BUGNE|nr:hypothetical protein EB796_001970 [Bugula neritina]
MKMVYPSVSSCPDNYRPLPYECAPCGCAKKAICSKELSYHCPKGGRCKRGRYGQGCVFGIISLSNDQANPYEPTNVTCIIRTADPNSDTGNIFLNIDGYLSPEYKPIEVTPSEVNPGNLKAVFYLTYGLNVGERYTCSVGDEEGQVVSRSATALLYELPVLTRTLDLHPMAHEGSYLSLLVNRWDPSVGDTGDGPVIGYIIKRCLHTETENCSSVNYPSYHYLVEVLDYNRTDNFSIPVNTYFTPTPGSTYSFIYKARRPGLWGIGPASNPLTIKIPCQKPVAAPVTHDNYTMNLMNSSKKVEVSISWELPTSVDHYHRCNNVTSFTVQLMQKTGVYIAQSVTYDITSLSTLVEPYSLYTVLLSYTNNEGYESDRHRLVLERTPPASPDACRVTGVYMVSKNSARVYWDKPQYPHGQITTYQVFFKRPKFLAFEEACKVQSTRGHCTISKLRMDTNYDIMVRAENEAGYGDNSSVWRFTTYLGEPGPVENFQNISKTESYIEFSWLPPKSNGGYPVKNFKVNPPLPTIPKFIEEKNTDTSIALEISSAKGCSLYRVVVMEITSISKRSIDTQTSTQTKVEDCQKCCEGSCYIAGELNVEELPMTFIVGNNKSYNNYFNPPLVTGKQYQIWYGAGNTVDGVEKFSFVSLDQPVVAREHVQEKSPIMASSTLIGIIVAVCACAVVMIVLVMLLVRHKRNKKFRFRTPDSEKVLELNENGTLLPNGTYQRGQ